MTAETHSHAVFFGIRVCSRQDAKSAKGKQNDERGRNRQALPYQSFGSGPSLLETLHGDWRMGFVLACGRAARVLGDFLRGALKHGLTRSTNRLHHGVEGLLVFLAFSALLAGETGRGLW